MDGTTIKNENKEKGQRQRTRGERKGNSLVGWQLYFADIRIRCAILGKYGTG